MSTSNDNSNDETAKMKKEEEEEEKQTKDDEKVDDEEMDEEEQLFATMEKEQDSSETKENTQTGNAPKLLQEALKSGELKNDSNNEEKKGDEDQDTSKTDDTQQQTNDALSSNQRANQLDILLSKASQYSSFIAKDLEELQNHLAEDAQRKMERQQKKRKRKKGNDRASKKAKMELQKAMDKRAEINASARPIFIQPKNLAEGCVLKDYQLEGVRWLVSLFENGVSGILADEMGLGKTIQVISMIAHLLLMGVSGPFLIVAPLATLPNWVREFQKWLPGHAVVRYHGPANEREAMLKGPLNPRERRNPNFPFIVTSYEVAIRDQAKLERLSEFTYMIVDEGQRLKNHRCTLLRSLKRIKSQNRLLLSGTPIQNSLTELWSLLNFINPTIFDDLTIFQSWFGFKDIGQRTHGATKEQEIIMKEREHKTVSKLHEILRPFLLRRIKKDVLTDIPPKKEVVVYAGLSKLQSGYADLIEQGVLRDQLVDQGLEQARSLSQTNKQMNHRKNVNHPFLFGEPIDPTTGQHLGTAHPHLLVRASGKFALLDRMLNRLFRDKHQVLIFSQMTKLLNVIEDYLVYRKWKYCRIDGSTHVDERQRQMDVFNAEKTSGKDGGRNEEDDRHFVFLLSTRAGGIGINLTCADTCIIFDSDWNPHQDSQAMDRCHRIGQTRPVAVYRLLTVGSVDIEMMEKQISKKKLERMAIVGGAFKKPGSKRAAISSTTEEPLSVTHLSNLLSDDIKDLQTKGGAGNVENVKISDEEFELIMNRETLFSKDLLPEGKMYDVIDAKQGDLLGSMT